MACLKCGVEIPDTQVFCDHCLFVMEAYPVKPGAHVHLPKRASQPVEQKKPGKKKRVLPPEEQIALLRMKVLRTRLLAVILAFILCLVSSFLLLKVFEDFAVPETGRNYTIDTTADN